MADDAGPQNQNTEIEVSVWQAYFALFESLDGKVLPAEL
jgi:hypothetical protein